MAGDAIAACQAMFADGARVAHEPSAIDICLSAILDAVLALTRDARMRADAAGVAGAIGVNLATFAQSASGACTAAIYVRLRAVFLLVNAGIRSAHAGGVVAGTAGAVGVRCAGDSDSAARRASLAYPGAIASPAASAGC